MEPNAESALKTLVCVEFPGKVVNADRAIQCLGGLNKIAKVCYYVYTYTKYFVFLLSHFCFSGVE